MLAKLKTCLAYLQAGCSDILPTLASGWRSPFTFSNQEVQQGCEPQIMCSRPEKSLHFQLYFLASHWISVVWRLASPLCPCWCFQMYFYNFKPLRFTHLQTRGTFKGWHWLKLARCHCSLFGDGDRHAFRFCYSIRKDEKTCRNGHSEASDEESLKTHLEAVNSFRPHSCVLSYWVL